MKKLKVMNIGHVVQWIVMFATVPLLLFEYIGIETAIPIIISALFFSLYITERNYRIITTETFRRYIETLKELIIGEIVEK